MCFDKNILDATDALFNDFDLNKVTHPKIEHHEGYSSYISQGNNGNSDLDKAGVKWIEFEKNKEKTMVDLTGFDIEHTKFCATKNIKLKELTVQNIKNPE
ncbi:hypothetical protein FACS1894166_09770 [Bacilli bacterium]|nr:hypothetical protein FACS1894166_09770 [Bacilli bacterium]